MLFNARWWELIITRGWYYLRAECMRYIILTEGLLIFRFVVKDRHSWSWYVSLTDRGLEERGPYILTYTHTHTHISRTLWNSVFLSPHSIRQTWYTALTQTHAHSSSKKWTASNFWESIWTLFILSSPFSCLHTSFLKLVTAEQKLLWLTSDLTP